MPIRTVCRWNTDRPNHAICRINREKLIIPGTITHAEHDAILWSNGDILNASRKFEISSVRTS